MLCLLFCCALRAPASAAKAGDFSYSLLEDGTAVITGYSGSEKELTIPAAVDGHPVSRIGADAFWGSPTLRRAVIPEGVTEIGSYAFAWCKKLDQVILPQSLAVLGDWAFWSSALRRVDIPDGVREISGTVFGNCENLRTVTVSAGHPALMLMDGAMLVRRSDMELIWYPTAKRPSSCVIPDGVRSIGYGEEQKEVIDLVRWLGDFAYYNICHIFASRVAQDLKESEQMLQRQADGRITAEPLLAHMPDIFTLQQFREERIRQGQSSEVKVLLSRYCKSGKIERMEKGVYRKLKVKN